MPIRAPAAATLTPDIFDFAPQALGTASQPNTATITNTSNSTVRIRDILASGFDFTETDTCKGTPPPGANCTIGVTFAPAVTGPRLGTIIITDSDPASPHFLGACRQT